MIWLMTALVAAALLVAVINRSRAKGPVQVDDSKLSPDLFLEEQFEAVPGRKPIDTGAFGTVEISRPKPSPLSTALKNVLPAASDSGNACVAIKYLRYSDDPVRNEEMDNALKKEIAPLRHCDHPNILRVLGLWRDPKMRVGIVSQFADEGALPTYLKKNPKFPVLTKILRDVAGGLEFLHKQPTGENQVGIAHGDLHPGNVLIMTDGGNIKAVLGDFGLCKIVDEHGMTSNSLRNNGVAGLAAYLGPELYRPGDLGDVETEQEEQSPKYAGHRTVKGDIFAFGMLSFTTLGGDLKPALCSGSGTALLPMPVAISIVKGRRPLREHLLLGEDAVKLYRDAIDTYWDAITACWQHNAAKRPAIENVMDKIPSTNPRE